MMLPIYPYAPMAHINEEYKTNRYGHTYEKKEHGNHDSHWTSSFTIGEDTESALSE